MGYSGFKGEVNGEKYNFGSGTFRFKPDGSKMEFLHQFNNNTWGIGLNEQGDIFGSTATITQVSLAEFRIVCISGEKTDDCKDDREFSQVLSNNSQYPSGRCL